MCNILILVYIFGALFFIAFGAVALNHISEKIYIKKTKKQIFNAHPGQQEEDLLFKEK